jgi:hypothetical protein
MDRRHLATVTAWLEESRGWPDALDRTIRRSRGPRGLPLAALLAGLVYNSLDGKPPTVAAVHATFLNKCNARQRVALGLPPGPVPSVHAFYRTLDRLESAVVDGRLRATASDDPRLAALAEAQDIDEALVAVLDLVVQSTVPPPDDGERLWSADTTYLDANCRPISRARYDKGERASDPDASGRRIKRPDGTEKQVFGYAITTVVRSDGTREFIDALRVDTASAHDRPKVLDMVGRLKDQDWPIERLAIDRGIKSKDLNAELRAIGIEPVFDLDANEGGYEGTYRGLLIVDGWLYSPALPKRLRQSLPKPLATGPDGREKLAQWQKDMDERQRYAWRVRQELGPGRVQLMPPVGVGCRHPALRSTMRARDLSLATCPGDHDSDEACGLKTLVWDAARAPITWQNPPWGSRKWQREYAKRSSVERSYSLLKSSDVVQLKDKAIKLRGLVKFAIMVAVACAAVNLRLASLPAKVPAAARGSPPEPRAA